MRIESLTFFRFMAAAIVVIFHYGTSSTGLSGIIRLILDNRNNERNMNK